MRRITAIIITILLSFSMVFLLSACSSESEDIDRVGPDGAEIIETDETDEYDNGIVFDEESEGADLKFAQTEPADFCGQWEATSGQSLYLYGNIDLNISQDGSWSGNVADEDISGKWTASGNGITLSSELFNAELAFTEDGALVLREDRDGTLQTAVLTGKE